MKWVRDKFGGLVPGWAKPEPKPAQKDPLELQADVAARHFGFDDKERSEYLKMQRALEGNPALLKKLIRRQRMFLRAARMSPTIKSRPYKRSRRSK